MSQQRGLLRKAMAGSITIAAASYLVGCFSSELAANERGKRRKGMREEKEIRQALKRLKDEHLRRTEDPKCPITGSTHLMVGVILTLE